MLLYVSQKLFRICAIDDAMTEADNSDKTNQDPQR